MKVPFRLPERDLNEILVRSESDLLKLTNADVLITGASGFVGSWLTESILFAKLGMGGQGTVTNLNRNPSDFQEELSHLGLLDLISEDIRYIRPNEDRYEFVIHAATPASAKMISERPDELLEVIVDGSRSVAESFLGPQVRLLNLSSGAVYGRQSPGSDGFEESQSVLTSVDGDASVYEKGKILAERLLIEEGDQKRASVLNARLFAFLAPLLPQDRHFAAGNFIRDAIVGRPITVSGDPTTVRSYQYGTDMIVMLLSVLGRAEHKQTFNVGSDIPITIGDFAEMIAQISGTLVNYSPSPQTQESKTNHQYVPSIQKINQVLNCSNQVGLHEAITRTLSWNQLNRNA